MPNAFRYFIDSKTKWFEKSQQNPKSNIGFKHFNPVIMVIFAVRSLHKYFATSRAIVTDRRLGKESPDSTEQCTGEEPASPWFMATEKVPQEITSRYPSARAESSERVKTWGKSSRPDMATYWEGKPCMLKCHIGRRTGAIAIDNGKELLVQADGWADWSLQVTAGTDKW